MKQLTVEFVKDANEWGETGRRMVTWTLEVSYEGKQETIQIRSKPEGNQYKAGDIFWAEPTDKEYKGMKTWKRVQAPQGGTTSSPPPMTGSVNAAGVALMSQKAAIPYEEIHKLFGAMTELFNEPSQWNGIGTAVLTAIIRGEVTSPIKAKTTVTYFGNVLETAGVEQAAWDEIDGLCTTLEGLSDKMAVRALLIATCACQSRKDLTAEKAELFAAALRANIAAAKTKRQQQAPQDDGSIPF